MAEDFSAEPIEEDTIRCALGDFEAGSYNISVYLRNDKRSGGSLSSPYYLSGLAIVFDHNGFYEPSLLRSESRASSRLV